MLLVLNPELNFYGLIGSNYKFPGQNVRSFTQMKFYKLILLFPMIYMTRTLLQFVVEKLLGLNFL